MEEFALFCGYVFFDNFTGPTWTAMRGWFDAFRTDGGPTLYNFNNRTAVTGDVTIITILTIFVTIYAAFLIIFPGIRKERFTTFFTVTLSVFVGATILVSMFGSTWQISHATIKSTYKKFSKEKLLTNIGVYVGLGHVNITLQVPHTHNRSLDVDFNERFYWINADYMRASFEEAKSKGLPFPILTVTEYFDLGHDGLSYGSQYRAAGYYAVIMLWASLIVWILMNLMLIAVPRYGALLMTTCGFLLLATCCGYFNMLPLSPLVIYVDEIPLDFSFGWCFWLVVIAGGICLLSGVIITTIEIIFPHSFSTILEVDYDTPFDRHVIIEDSHGKRYQRKRLSGDNEESLGFRILKRLSSKTRDDKIPSPTASSPVQRNFYEMTSPKWKYSNNSTRHNFSRSPSQVTISTISRPSNPDISKYRMNISGVPEVAMW